MGKSTSVQQAGVAAKRELYECARCIQASARAVLQTLGLDRLIGEAGGVRNPIEVHTPSGWVGSHLEQGPDGAPDHGYNIRRLRLDPMVRGLTERTPGVTLITGMPASGLTH